MKKVLQLTSLLFLAVVLSNCGKGDGDPAISLKSRKSRLVGTWNIDSYVKTFNITSSSSSVNVQSNQGTTITYNGTYSSSTAGTETISDKIVTVVSTETNNNLSQWTGDTYREVKSKNGTGNVIASIEFSKDGTFTRTIEYTNQNFVINAEYVSSGISASEIINSIESKIEKSTGYWEFLGKVSNEYKNKERIILKLSSSDVEISYSDNRGLTTKNTDHFEYSSSDNSEIWTLTTLGKNELEFEADFKFQNNYSNNQATVTSNSNGSTSTNGSTINSGTVVASLSK